LSLLRTQVLLETSVLYSRLTEILHLGRAAIPGGFDHNPIRSAEMPMQERRETLPPALPREVPDYHERQASHCRALAATAPGAPLKARLLQEAERHERLAGETRGEPPGEGP
jgi:hypothetical protein